MRLAGKIAVVTGGSQGIGEAIARRYAAEGAHAVIVYSRDDRAARTAVEGIVAAGGRASAVKADCSVVPDVTRMIDGVGEEHGGLDILVNNAGVFRTMPIDQTTEEVWDEQLDLNLKGAFFAVKAALPWFRKRGGGKVINVSSIAGIAAFPNCAAYCASKGGLTNLTRAMAAELAAEKINVNAIGPGNVATQINAHLRGPDMADYKRLMSSRTPTGRAFMDVEDLTGAALFLASSDADSIHGAILMVDDGWSV